MSKADTRQFHLPHTHIAQRRLSSGAWIRTRDLGSKDRCLTAWPHPNVHTIACTTRLYSTRNSSFCQQVFWPFHEFSLAPACGWRERGERWGDPTPPKGGCRPFEPRV